MGLEEQTEMDVGPDTQVFSMELGGGAAPAAAPAAAPVAPAAAAAAAAPAAAAESGRIVPLKGWHRGMAKHMVVQPGDTIKFTHFETVNFDNIKSTAKAAGVTPAAVLVKNLGETVKAQNLN